MLFLRFVANFHTVYIAEDVFSVYENELEILGFLVLQKLSFVKGFFQIGFWNLRFPLLLGFLNFTDLSDICISGLL